MQWYMIDPLRDPRWEDLVSSHPRASAFHTRGWLSALANTYGYRPVVLTSAPPGQPLSDGIAFCEIRSWITGSRLVSLPFSDHAEPLLSEMADGLELEEWLRMACSSYGWKYVELRPVFYQPKASSAREASQSFWLHRLDLAPPLEQLFSNTHKSSMQRRIRHAERENLAYERGSSEELLHDFYELLVMTRKRHRIFPQPQSWFRNLLAGSGINAEIRLARKDGVPIAAIFTLSHGETVVYKYGCSNHQFHHFGGMPFLFWQLIEESKSKSATQIDLGRTDMDHASLMEFKDRLGATRTRISYLRYAQSERLKHAQMPQFAAVRNLLSLLPDVLCSSLGRLVYRHLG